MSLTDYAGIAGLIAAVLLALWMIRGAANPTVANRSARHRGTPSLRIPKASRPERASRGNR